MRKLFLRLTGILTAMLLLSGCAASGPETPETTAEQQDPMQILWLLSNREDENNSSKVYYAYDGLGRIIRYEEKKTNSPPVVYYTYDDGNLTKQFLAADEAGTASEDKEGLKQTLRSLVGNPSEENVQYKIIHIDTNGFPVTQMCLDGEMNVEWTLYYTYDDRGNCVKELTVYPDSVYEVNGTFDGQGNQILRTTYDSAKDLSTVSQRMFDEKGNMIFRDKYQFPGLYEQLAEKEMTGYWEYEYDSEGRRTQETEYNTQREAQLILSYQYDNIGNVSRRVYHYPASGGSVAWRYSYQAFQVSDSQKEMLQRLYDDVIGFVIFNITDASAFQLG